MTFGKDISPDVGLATRFQPGVVTNPAGRPKGTPNLSTHIQNLLNDENFDLWLNDPIDGYKKYDGVPIKAIVSAAIKKAVAGDQRWAEWLAKYGYGSKITVEHSEIKGEYDADKAGRFAKFLEADTKS